MNNQPIDRKNGLSWITWVMVTWVVATGCSQVAASDIDSTVEEPSTDAAPVMTLTISAAASLQDVMREIQPLYESTYPNTTVIYNFGSSGSLQQQIEQGAPVDVFLSASPKQIDALEQKGLLVSDSRRDVLTNSVVLIAPSNNPIVTRFDTLGSEQIQRLSIGEPSSVPAGQYGKEILETLGLYQSIQPKIVFAKDVRQVLTYVATGNIDAGLVYRTDVQQSDRVRIVAEAPNDAHSPITYPGAAIAHRPTPDIAVEFLDFLETAEAIAIFNDHGFIPVP